ncbi:sperm axonemal maintenance protein CFAP97D1-like [Antedon mediterranea]|uniref:sperm axonemal maintenance protein CFAP97D1-like n=1 Tax=Antedon mediterranea TaxID=105859 RepID=UPI003AF83CF3
MHKSYQSILPCQSRILQKRWDLRYYEEHRQKVKEAKSMVDTSAPKTYVHLHLKLKKLQLEEERLATIERDNRILLEKMSLIMRTKGRVDNRNDYEYKSLNKEKRQRELLRVTRENQEILRRILAREPEYNHLKWEQEWEENEAFIDNISRFPRDWWELEQKEKELQRLQTAEAKANRSRPASRKNKKKDNKAEEENEEGENTEEEQNKKEDENNKEDENKEEEKESEEREEKEAEPVTE